MSHLFAAMEAVRSAFDTLSRNPLDAVALSNFKTAYDDHRHDFVPSFELDGVTYPRTDGHQLSEKQARQAIDALLDPLRGARFSIADIKPSVIEAAFPLQEEMLRHEIKASVAAAEEIVKLDWKTASWPPVGHEIRELLRMPTETGTYKYLTALRAKKYLGNLNPYRGYQADHLIPDEALRGFGVTRKLSDTDQGSMTTYVLDGQNKGSQHKFVTDAQVAVKNEFIKKGVNPTVEEYLEYVFVWMTELYTCADLGVDVSVKNKFLKRATEIEFYVKGYAIAQAGFMTWKERQMVGRAIATVLMIEAREFYARNHWALSAELALIKKLDVPPSVAHQPVPN